MGGVTQGGFSGKPRYRLGGVCRVVWTSRGVSQKKKIPWSKTAVPSTLQTLIATIVIRIEQPWSYKERRNLGCRRSDLAKQMTAEIAILNKSAVALAADSAVTIGRGSSAKIYNSVNKIFELHQSAPVGVMVYGSLIFMGLPIETLIKKYRADLGATTFPKISDYRDHFTDWLGTNVPIGQPDEEMSVMMIALDIVTKINAEASEKILEHIRNSSKYLKSKENGIASKVILKEISDVKIIDRLPYVDKKYIRGVEAKYGSAIDTIIDRYVNQFTPNQKNKSLIHKLINENIFRGVLSSYRTGLVVAGFGDDEWCPSLEHIEIEGVINQRLKWLQRNSIDIGRRGPHAEALGFAQSDMIDRFLHGSDPDMQGYAESLIRESITETAREVIAALQGVAVDRVAISPALQQVIGSLQDEQLKNLDAFKEREYSRPIKDMITHMPKTEMATLAKSLIDLTSLKRKVTREQESVGGEVDVAVISKAEGFVWVSRKHYFPREFNSRFFARHYHGIGETP